MGALTPAQAYLASGLAGASGSLAGGLLSANSASANNRTALEFNKWSQLQAQQFQQQMYTQQRNDQESFYKKYQSPQAIAAALSQLGVNPAVPLSGGHGVGASPASMPSGVSSPALSAPALQNEGESLSSSIQAIGNGLASIAQASSTSEQSEEMAQTFITRVNRMMLDNVGQKLSNDNAQFNLLASQARLPYEITQLVSKAFVDFTQGNLNIALKRINDVTAYVKEHTKDIDIKYQNELLRLLGVQINDVNEAVNLKKEEQNTEKSKQAANYASANASNASARYSNALAKISEIQGEKDVATKAASIKSLGQQIIRDNLLAQAEQKEYAIKMARLQDIINAREYTDSNAFMDSFLSWLKDKVSIFK